MRFTYKNNEYELMEMKEPNKNESFDVIAIFQVIYIDSVYDCKVPKEVYDDCEDGSVIEKYQPINYFYGADNEDEELIKIAKEYIDLKS